MTPRDWSKLSHAYGCADDLPEILDQLTPDPSNPIWGELWGRVCHQGTTYSASPHVLPRLLEVARSWVDTARARPLALAGGIVASREFKAEGFEDTVRALLEVARETASARELSRLDRVYVMSSALVFAGDSDWGQELDGLNDQEFVGRCPSCDVEFYLTIGDRGHFASEEDPLRSDIAKEQITPCDSDSLHGSSAWLYETALAAGDEELATRIRCVFGQSVCPACKAPFRVAEAIERFWHA